MTNSVLAEKAVSMVHQNVAMPVFGAKPVIGALNAHHNSLGALLIDAGKLKLEQAEPILRAQREHQLRFGEAAVKLGFVTQADVDMAVSRQFEYPYLRINDPSLAPELFAAYQPFSVQVEALRGLRSQLMLRWFDPPSNNKTLAIVSPERGEGRSFIAANLAVVFSQLGEHTLLIDADMRNPRQHALFKLGNVPGLSAILSGRGDLDSVCRIPTLVDLSVLPAGSLPPNPQELLARPLFSNLLSELANEFDVIIIDTPAGKDCADAQTIAARAHGALMVMHTSFTRLQPTRVLAQNIAEAGSAVVGSVMNSF